MDRVKNPVSRLIIGAIKFYKKAISPHKIPCCRFTPSCSAYAIEAIATHGAFRGSYLAVKRVLRCNPLCKGGYDPVPPKRAKK